MKTSLLIITLLLEIGGALLSKEWDHPSKTKTDKKLDATPTFKCNIHHR